MSEELNHYGIKGMKWGVRRTPQQLGHVTSKKLSEVAKQTPKVVGKKTVGKSIRKSTSISDDELRKRIERLNMEERYADLVARQNERSKSGFKSTAKKLLGNAAEDLGRQLLSKAVSKLVDKIAGDKKFDIDDYKNMDVKDMDADTIAKVSKWYGDATKISVSREKMSAKDTDKTASSKELPKKDDEGTKQKTNVGDTKLKTNEPNQEKGNSVSRSTSATGSKNVPWIYRASGTRYKKEAEKIAKDRRNRDKDILQWLI